MKIFCLLFLLALILADTYDELQDNITLKIVVILLTCVVKDGDKFYSQLFLAEALFLK